MRTYANNEEVDFFEYKRFSESHLPTYREIAFLIGIDINSEHWRKIADHPINIKLWERIKKLIYFDMNQKRELPNLRSQVFAKNPLFRELMEKGTIHGFETYPFQGTTLEEALKQVNIETYSSLYEYFATGANIGTCGYTSTWIGVMFKEAFPLYHRGIIPSFAGTPESENGSHAWITANSPGGRIVVDTSLLLVIPEQFKEELGYIPTHTYTLQQKIDERDVGEEYYYHYFLASKEPTENKASYEMYCAVRDRIGKKSIIDSEKTEPNNDDWIL